jgi:iron complex transport system substrate-binding protein
VKHRQFIAVLLVFCFVFGLIPAAAQEATVDPFPVTVEHKFGSTTITEAPERVVAIGFTEQDALLAVGVVPVAVRYWYGDTENAIFPWAVDQLDANEAPVVLNMPFGSLNYEAILALQPDLISAVGAGITQEEYDLLSQIAPTVAQSADYPDFGIPWQEATRMIGRSVGKQDEALALIAEVEEAFADAREAHPSFEGKTIAVAIHYDGRYAFFTGHDARARFFTDLGFVVPEELTEIAGENFYADLSAERIDLLDQDVLVFVDVASTEGGRETIENDVLISQLAAVREGRTVFVPTEYDDALQFSSVLSLEYALEGLLPELAAAVGEEAQETACETGFKPVTHALGETCVPGNAERVVALEWTFAEDLLALGLQPAGVADIEGYKSWLKIPVELDETVADVGTRQEPNLEAITALAPDLILAVNFRHAEIYDTLSAIAPTLMFDPYPADGTHYDEMLATFATVAQATGREAEAEAVLEGLTAKFAAARSALEAAGRGGETFILSQTYLASEVPTFRLFTDNALAVQVLEQIGLENAWGDAAQPYGFSTVDFEAFASIGDTNFLYVAQDEYQATLTGLPLWNGLPFVQSGRAYWLGGDAWLFGGPLSMQVVVDTVLSAMGIAHPEATE